MNTKIYTIVILILLVNSSSQKTSDFLNDLVQGQSQIEAKFLDSLLSHYQPSEQQEVYYEITKVYLSENYGPNDFINLKDESFIKNIELYQNEFKKKMYVAIAEAVGASQETSNLIEKGVVNLEGGPINYQTYKLLMQ